MPCILGKARWFKHLHSFSFSRGWWGLVDARSRGMLPILGGSCHYDGTEIWSWLCGSLCNWVKKRHSWWLTWCLDFLHVRRWVQDSTSISSCWWYSANVCQCQWCSKTHFSVLYHQRGTNHIFFQATFVGIQGGPWWMTDDSRNPLRKFWVQGRMAWLAIGSQLQESPRFGVGRFGGPHGGSGSPLEKMVPQHILDVFKTFRKQWSLFILEGWRD